MDNPYLDAFRALPGTLDQYGCLEQMNAVIDHIRQRSILTPKYAWAIPTEEAIKLIVSYSPLVEIGAGGGYWAWCIQQMGGDIIAYDIKPYSNYWCGEEGKQRSEGRAVDDQLQQIEPTITAEFPRWTHVHTGTPKVLAKHLDRTLFLCWPPYGDRMASASVRWHHSQRIIYVGEEDGATGDKAFQRVLHTHFEEVHSLAIPQWYGLHDQLWVYERKRKS